MNDFIQLHKVSVMQASPASRLLDALDGVELRAVGWQIIKRKAVDLFLPPFALKARMVVFGVANDDHHLPPTSATGGSQVAEIIPARHDVELLRFVPEEELAGAQADRTEITYAAPRRTMKQHGFDIPELYFAQAIGSSPSRPLDQAAQTALLKTTHPIFHRPERVAQKPPNLRTGHPPGYEQNPVQAMIVTRFLRTANLVLKSQNHDISISNGKWFHVPTKSLFLVMRNYL